MRRTTPWLMILMILVLIPVGAVAAQQPADDNSDPDPTSTQGCGTGYWRQDHHYDNWAELSPDDLVSDVLGIDSEEYADLTLGEAVMLDGGELDALLRHTVAALLNAASEEIDYPYTADEITTMFQEAYDSGDYDTLKDEFDEANDGDCPLGTDDDDDSDVDEPDDEPADEVQVTLCHIPGGNPNNGHLITVGASAVPAHLAHGDVLDACPPPDNSQSHGNSGNGGNGNSNPGQGKGKK